MSRTTARHHAGPARGRWISAAAVAAVATVALAAAWVTVRPLQLQVQEHAGRPDRPLDLPVVRAPPIDASPSDTSASGGPPACRDCGLVEAVAVQERHTRFEVRIRMDDGSTRTLQQAVPVLAGSRVVVRGGVARPLAAQGQQAQG
ncbi:MAG TPA: hypothetical protein VHA82_20835 [Ramlibacter sp.]|uniref:hypothetical protein n=1 Tax=Ramlibacter sp. TaxID=1917967 RepID=UPI002C9E4D4C|nr:hypothetical protein [Ramlibacter sp.]HVZ46263.1 hypothetical protein [Ramlibacter sp.]